MNQPNWLYLRLLFAVVMVLVDSSTTEAQQEEGTEKWTFLTGGSVASSPAIGKDGAAYVGSLDGSLYAINPDGTQKWAFPTGGRVISSSAIGEDGTIYVGPQDGGLSAISPDGVRKWAFPAGHHVVSSAAIGKDGTVYVGSLDGSLYAINPDGTQRWAFPTGNYVDSSPAIGQDGTVYVGSLDGSLYAINPDGTQKWAFQTGGGVFSSPAIGQDGTIYVGSLDGSLSAINGSSGGVSNSPWPMFHHDSKHTGDAVDAATEADNTLGGGSSVNAALALKAEEVATMVEGAVQAVDNEGASVVVVDRAGRVLAVWQEPGATLETAERALSLARTGAFFSNNQAPLSSRTVRYISGIHFPPGIPFQPNAALYGIENTNRGCSFSSDDAALFNPGRFVPRATSLLQFLREEGLDQALFALGEQPGPPLICNGDEQSGCGVGITTGKFTGTFSNGRLMSIPEEEILDQKPSQVHGGGLPIFRNSDGQTPCELVGGIGVYGIPPDQAEFAALVGSMSSSGFGPAACVLSPGAVFLDGIRLPFVQGTTQPPGTSPGSLIGSYLVPPRAGGVAEEGWLIGPSGSAELTVEDVRRIVQQSINQADLTRAAIRLPLGSRTRMVIAVSDLDGNVLALFRMPDATVFSIDVAVAKSRNVVYFSSARRDPGDLEGVPFGTAVTNRTISFGSQPLFPSGIDGTPPGPFFDLYVSDLADPCTQGLDQQNRPNINGVVFFPGSAPLYRSGGLVGGLGISGDGVEQDDVVTDGGSTGFEAPALIQADQILIQGVRLPYLKFNRNPGK